MICSEPISQLQLYNFDRGTGWIMTQQPALDIDIITI